MMPSVEEIVREMDDIFLSARASAIEISEKTGKNYHTTIKYVHLSRKEYLNAGYQMVVPLKKIARKQKKFEESIETKKARYLNRIPVLGDQAHEEKIEQALFCISRLKPTYRDVIIQRYLEGKTLKETGMPKNETPEVIRQRQERALKKLKKIVFAEEHLLKIHT